MSITPKTWGPCTWIMLHLITLSYPEKPSNTDIENHRNFLLSLSDILPCNECRSHFKAHLKKCAISHSLKSRDDYIKCVWNMHNGVAPEKAISFEEFMSTYKEIINMDGFNPIKINNERKFYKYATYTLLIIIIIIIIDKCKK
jgi:hypothetical protein